MMTLRFVVPGLVAVALVAAPRAHAASGAEPVPAKSYSTPLSAEVDAAIGPQAQTAETPAAAPAAAPEAAPAATVVVDPKASAPANTDKKATASLTAEELESQSGFGADVSLDHSMATSTFLASDACQTCAYVGGSLGVGARYTFKLGDVKLSVSGRWGVSLEYTLPDSDNGRRFSHSDIRFGLSAPGIVKIPVVDIKVNPSIGVTVPVTAESWSAGLITSLSAGLSFSRGWKYADLSASVSGSHGFYATTTNVGIQRSSQYGIKDPDGRNTFLCRTGESICGMLGNNPVWSLSGSLNLNVHPFEFPLAFGVSFGMGKTWKYAVTDAPDEYTCKTLDSNGNPACHTGLGTSDRMNANISASYSFNDHFSASLYLQNSQSPRLVDSTGQWAFRFPFADFATPASGTTALGLSLSGSF